ncbi:MAG TPA: GAF domain-containing sensor histidine kinase [Anaerolineae bacterium]|nr:GAF domain-containing sensor histidine kinase [Anaerolineae bacterium]
MLATRTMSLGAVTWIASGMLGGKTMDPLLEESRRRLRESKALFKVSQAFVSVLDLDELLQVIIDSAVETIDSAERGVIHILDEGSGELHPKALSGKALGALRKSKMRIGEGIAGHALEQGRAINVPDVNAEPLFVRDGDEPGFQSLLVVPLILGQKRIGTLSVDSERVSAFDEDDERLLMTLATQAAIAIENARLYQETLEEKRKMEIILEETFNGIVVVDSELRITAFNPGAETITGYLSKDVLGRRLPEVFGPEVWGEGSLLQKAATTGERVAPQEVVISGKLGARDTLLGVTPLRDSGGKSFGYLLSFADITHLKEVDRLKSNIVANVSHEFRAPLASIKAYTELLLDGLDEGDRATRQRFLTVIDQETDRLTALVNDFLDLSRLESGRFELRKRPLNLDKVVDVVISLLSVQARNRGIDIKVDIPSDLPPILADEELMATLIRNLLSNAVKFSHRGGEVEVKAREEDGQLILSVSDQGMGIPSEELPRLFEKFYRVQSATESGIEGTGLGPALAKEAAEAHGGRIEVESQVGVGSCFTVILPMASPDRNL